MSATLRLLLVLLAWSALHQSEAQAQSCTQLTTLNYTANGTATGDRRAATATVNGTTITTSGYSSPVTGGNTNVFSVGTNAALPSKALVWQQNTQGATDAVAGQPTTAATVTYTFSRPVTGLTLVLSDIDADATAGKFTDKVTFDGYVNATDATPITLVASDVTLGNQNTFVAGSNAVQGTGNSDADVADNVTVRFSQPVSKLVLSYQNAYPYNAADNRNQAMGINSIAFCSEADVYAQFTAGPATATASQNVVYTVAFGNNGPDIAATTVTRKVTVPTGATVTNLGGGTLSGNVIDFGNVSSLASGTSSSFTYAYNLPSTAGTYNNTATITAGTTATAYDPTANNSANRSVLVSAGATPCTTAPVDLDFRTRQSGENWKAKVLEGVPALASATKVSTAYSSADNNSTFAIGTLTGTTLRWGVDYSGGNGGDPNSSTVTYTFDRLVSNFSVRVQDIDGNVSGAAGSIGRSGFVDQVEFAASNGVAAVTPIVNKVVPTSSTLSVSGSIATAGTSAATSADDGAVVVSFANPIKTLTITYRNVVTGVGFLGAATTYAAQAVGIDLMSWCRLQPVANNVTTATLPSSAGQVSISGLSSAVDGMVQNYTLTSVPTAAQGVLYYNSNGSTYTAITAVQTLTAAQAATLRFDPAPGASGNITFGYTVTDDADLVSNTATYTIPVNDVTCTVNTTAINFATRPSEDWKAHPVEGFPAGSPRTAVSTSGYTTPTSATISTFMTAPVNGVQTLQWLTDYANTTAKSSSVTFNFSRAVSNFAIRVQDIDAVQNDGNSFIDQVTFSGANGATVVTPALSAVNPDNGAVIINGNMATGTVNNTSIDDASVVAYFASPITSLTLTYANTSTYNTNPTQQAIGIDLMSWCQLAPTAAAVANASLPATAPQTAITALSGTADGVIQFYTLGAVTAGSGVLYVNGVPATAGQQITPAQAAQLSFDPNPNFVGTAAFTYTSTDGQNNTSAAANYTIPVSAVADVTTALSGPATLNPGQPSGTYTATFTNLGPSVAGGVLQTVGLPAGATNVLVNGAAYTPTGNVISFGPSTTLASGTTNSFTFSFTPATTATGTLGLLSTVSTTTPEGTNAGPNSSNLSATVAPVADVATTIVATTTSVAAGTLASATTPPKYTATFSNNGPVTASGVTAAVQLPAGLTNVTATNGGVYNSTTGVISYAGLTSLANGATTTSVITFDAPIAGPVMATSTIATTNTEATLTANNQASASMSITPAFDLVSMLSGPASAVQGNLVTLALTTTNNGPSAATGATPTIQLVAGLSNVFVSNGGSYDSGTGLVTFPAIGTLPNGQTVTNSVSFRAPATAFAPSALVTPNTAGAGETSIANNTGYLNGAATSTNLTISGTTTDQSNIYTKVSTTTPGPNAGSPVSVTVVTGNNGPMSAPNVVQTVQLLPGLAASIQLNSVLGTLAGNLVTFASGATYNNLTGIVTYPTIASQASGSSVSSTITFTAPANVGNNGQLLVMAAVRNDNTDPVPADNVANTTVVVTPTTDLTATLMGPTSVIAGQPVRYTATFVNNGPAVAGGYNVAGTQTSGVTETVQLPAGLTAVSITDAAGTTVTGATYNATTGLVTFPTLTTDPVGAVQAFNISFVAPAASFVVRSNVTTATPDGSPAGNTTSLAATVTPTADLTTTIAGPASAVAGNAVTYSTTTTNAGPSAAASVVPTIQLAAGLTTVSVSNGSYNSVSGLVTFNTTPSLLSGASVTNSVTFVMPNPASGQIAGVASATSSTIDRNAGNGAASVATSVAPATAVAASATSATADVVAAVSAASSVAANSPITFTATFSNSGTDAAANVVPSLQLPAGLTMGTISNSGVYNPTTGLVSWPVIASLANGSSVAYTVTLTAPATGSLVATATTSATTSEPATAAAQSNDVAQATVSITAVFDEVTALSGPASALPGTSQTYTVTAVNNGPSPTANATIQTVTLPVGVVASNISNGGVQTGNVITWTIPAGQVSGAAGGVANTFTIVQPAAGASLSAAVAVTGESNTANSTTSFTSAATNQPPVAYMVVNTLQGPRGNTAAALPIDPLRASDPENALSTTAAFTLVSVPTAAQGVLSYNNGASYVAATAGQTLTATQAASLRFQPTAGYVGNAAFSYLTTDNAGNQSMAVNYSIPVAADMNSTYQVYNAAKGGSNKYQTGDALAQVVDPNTVVYNSTGAVYNTAGVLQSGAANGLATTGTNAVLASGTLPTGVSLDPATGRIYVSNAALLPRITTATSYPLTITTTDLNGGTNTVPVTFTLGAYPLPVELVSFTAQAVNNADAALAWTTASEKNNARFEVERSLNGTDYAWIGQVNGQGSTSQATAYALTDAGIGPKAAGLVYYRLKQVDADGAFSYSPVRSLSFAKNLAPALGLYPNPAAGATTLDLRQLPAGAYEVRVLDATGRVVVQVVRAAGLAQALGLEALASGSYTVQVLGQGLRLSTRLVKQ
ncbi:T9SS type A sorting domain-containing protein [Hymenobacter negativus]|uniref:T9SS type A sorting domain-containing protein n=1 Tax=Hymenobacter negativus TaxID=2795026 RepID=A0ABS3QM98_9BACT|nr:T9SS type A sorting domain-containing protein [Hymenobacter negativus]MBO2012247.1 T9SS type A sorting domain-containing protein [Hymenobacter negativus]